MRPAPGPYPPGQPRHVLVDAVGAGLSALPRGAAAIVALSGGPDSSALAYLAAEARPDLELTLAHVRHGLRDDREDRAVVAQHAAWLGLPLVERSVEPVATGRGPEAAAREARYQALHEVATARGAAWILVGHTADDQAETVLLRAARGTGTDGLAAMAVVRDRLVRPLLRLRRSDLRRFLTQEGLPSVEDPTNVDPAVRRAVVRHEVLPVLGRAAADPVGALARLADLCRADSDALETWAEDVGAAAVRRLGPVRCVPDHSLDAVPAAVARRVIRRLITEVGGASQPPDATTVARVLALRPGQAASLSDGVQATAGGGWRAVAPARLPTADPVPLCGPGTVVWQPAEVELAVLGPETPTADGSGPRQVALELLGAWSPPRVRIDPAIAPPGGDPQRLSLALPADLGGLIVRHRAPGDRVATAVGTRRVQDVLVDAGVPRPVRQLWPVVVDGDDRVVWIPGLVADAEVLRSGRVAPAALLVCRAPVPGGQVV